MPVEDGILDFSEASKEVDEVAGDFEGPVADESDNTLLGTVLQLCFLDFERAGVWHLQNDLVCVYLNNLFVELLLSKVAQLLAYRLNALVKDDLQSIVLLE